MLRVTLQQLSLWQVKEFRLDRVTAHLRLPSVRAQLVSPLALAKWGALAWWLVDPAWSSARSSLFALTTVYAGETAWFVREIAQRAFRRPHLSPRIGILLSGVMLAAALLTVLGRVLEWPWTLTLLALDRGLFALVAAIVFGTVPVTAWKRRRIIRRAAHRMRAISGLTTVGITGSFGKSSTKEFLALLAGARFHVLKTPANTNTDVGIAQVILKDLTEQHTLFVCEMGAYRLGEIARAAALVHPRIGILAAVRDQHLALFGSLEELARAKGELLRALPETGVAIVNGDDPMCVRLSRESPAARVVRYGFREGNDVRGEKLSVRRDQFHLTVRSRGTTHQVDVPLLGGHQAGNLLGAWAAAEVLGVSPDELAARAPILRPLPRTMEPRTGPRNTFVVDDTYSANPDGVAAALEYLPAAAARTTVVILTTMIELGSASAAAHRRIGETLRRVKPDLTVVTARDFARDLIAGAANGGSDVPLHIVVEPRPERAFSRIEPLLGAGTVVLLEGRIPESLRQKFLSSA
ncbi:MAG: UDP-N-acetylmuramoyl-tripeptide--D-alanyl-D-alanine ligase [Parcubacteria group bacterium Gr01-1014_38]|nr:MAG: UDP-N-acetylmuramoyl-tripeptide--D-alanyl-D-alanine ligase [Parcubacteria group bacterium Gr01-1014_38]